MSDFAGDEDVLAGLEPVRQSGCYWFSWCFPLLSDVWWDVDSAAVCRLSGNMCRDPTENEALFLVKLSFLVAQLLSLEMEPLQSLDQFCQIVVAWTPVSA